MPTGFALDPDQGLSEADEVRLVRLAADLGYESAWTNSGADAGAFDRCLRWHDASGLPVGISAVPASGRPAPFYAQHAQHLWDATNGRFTLVVGSGLLPRPAQAMRPYLTDLRQRLPAAMPLYVAALGPLMLGVAGELADGVALNWCTAEWIEWSRQTLVTAALAAGRPVPRVVEYVRTAVDPDAELARGRVAAAALRYALGMPACGGSRHRTALQTQRLSPRSAPRACRDRRASNSCGWRPGSIFRSCGSWWPDPVTSNQLAGSSRSAGRFADRGDLWKRSTCSCR
ncbi:MAG: LLM class flavin-dependent oxidoreductase [Chloroflexi bacterium]|nr:MAG: LLM class flavin-dependent oxidoreductase [Chloroflexota bacterium]